MKQFLLLCVACATMLVVLHDVSSAQKPSWMVGMRVGMSLASGGAKTTTYNYYTGRFEESGGGTKAGLQFGPTAEVIFNNAYAIVENLNINTQSGTPIEWASFFKYYFTIPRSKIRPYADAGFGLWFVTGGPYVGLPFGGGALFEVGKNLYIPADLQFGPIFVTDNTIFGVEITSGIRFEF